MSIEYLFICISHFVCIIFLQYFLPFCICVYTYVNVTVEVRDQCQVQCLTNLEFTSSVRVRVAGRHTSGFSYFCLFSGSIIGNHHCSLFLYECQGFDHKSSCFHDKYFTSYRYHLPLFLFINILW